MLIMELELILTFCLKYSGESPSRCKIFSSRSASLLYTSHGTGFPRHDHKSNKMYVCSLNFTMLFLCTWYVSRGVCLRGERKGCSWEWGGGCSVSRFLTNIWDRDGRSPLINVAWVRFRPGTMWGLSLKVLANNDTLLRTHFCRH